MKWEVFNVSITYPLKETDCTAAVALTAVCSKLLSVCHCVFVCVYVCSEQTCSWMRNVFTSSDPAWGSSYKGRLS